MFSALYVVPGLVTAWLRSARSGVVVAIAASAAGMASTAIDPREVSTAVISWNGLFRLLTYLLVVGLVQQLRTATASVRLLADTDAMTGLSNRRQLLERLEDELARARRRPDLVAVAYIDLDAAVVVARLVEQLREHEPPIRVSIGILVVPPNATLETSSIVTQADALMLEAKRAGGDRVTIGTAERIAP